VKKLIFPIMIGLFFFCAQQAEDVLVRVDGSVLTKADFEKYITEADYSKVPEEQIRQFCEKWADQEILYLEAKKQGIDKEDSIRLVLKEYEKNLLAMDLVRREFSGTTVDENEIKAYFNEHEKEFLYAVKLGQIVLPDIETARMTLQEIKAGADFFKLAKERSLTRFENPEDPKVVTDYLPRGTLGDFGIEETIFNMKRGEISDVIPYVQGTYLLVKMIDKKKMKSKADYDAYKGAIYNYLLAKKYQDFLSHYVDSLKTQYKVTIDLSVLKEKN